jgi:hypothetical protein
VLALVGFELLEHHRPFLVDVLLWSFHRRIHDDNSPAIGLNWNARQWFCEIEELPNLPMKMKLFERDIVGDRHSPRERARIYSIE